MAKRFARKDFLIKDLAISVGGGGGGTWLPGPDDETPPTPISPIASVLVYLGVIEAVRGTIADAVKSKNFEEIGRAFVAGDGGGSPAIRAAIHDLGTAVIASAAFAEIAGASSGLPNPDDPNCGSSVETFPPTTTPVLNIGLAVHRVSELPRLRKQLAETISFLENAAAARAPQGDEIGEVRAELEGALKSLA
jgi:hypothetical protein